MNPTTARSSPAQPVPGVSQFTATCDSWYPKSAGAAGLGTTKISLDVRTDGTTANPKLVQSSGSPDLDSAAMNCARAAHLKPATDHGQPIVVTRQYDVHWSATGHSVMIPSRATGADPTPFSCHDNARGYVPFHPAPTVIDFQIGTDGAARDPQVKQSSGSAGLDRAAMRCVLSSFRYVPATQNGEPVQIDDEVQFEWNRQ